MKPIYTVAFDSVMQVEMFDLKSEAEAFANEHCSSGSTWQVNTVTPPPGMNRQKFIGLMQNRIRNGAMQ